MLKTYKLKKEPVFSEDYQETTIQTEDFHKIMRLANSYLNCPQASEELPGLDAGRDPTNLGGETGSHHHHYHDQRQFIGSHFHQIAGSEPQPKLAALRSLVEQFQSSIFFGFPVCYGSPLSFLSSRLSQFTKATRIFTTRDYTHTNV